LAQVGASGKRLIGMSARQVRSADVRVLAACASGVGLNFFV
jgi:hypothetical protein